MNTTALVPTLPPANGHAAGRALVIDLSEHPDTLDRLYHEALRRGVPLATLVSDLFARGIDRILPPAATSAAHHTDPDGRAAYAAGRGLNLPEPEGKN